MVIEHDEMIAHLSKVNDLPRLTTELMEIVDRIPYFCGRPDCVSDGCVAIRQAREKLREIYNAHPGIPNPNYKERR